jgi:hypothetical protein
MHHARESVEVEDCAAITFEMADGSLAASTTTLGCADEVSRHRSSSKTSQLKATRVPYDSPGDPWKFAADTPELQLQSTLPRGIQPQPSITSASFSASSSSAAGARAPRFSG